MIPVSPDRRVKVIFMMWGQECETICLNEQAALIWLSTCSDKGWLLAETIMTMEGVVLHEGEELYRKTDS